MYEEPEGYPLEGCYDRNQLRTTLREAVIRGRARQLAMKKKSELNSNRRRQRYEAYDARHVRHVSSGGVLS